MHYISCALTEECKLFPQIAYVWPHIFRVLMLDVDFYGNWVQSFTKSASSFPSVTTLKAGNYIKKLKRPLRGQVIFDSVDQFTALHFTVTSGLFVPRNI
jgi:hypothetical protein